MKNMKIYPQMLILKTSYNIMCAYERFDDEYMKMNPEKWRLIISHEIV